MGMASGAASPTVPKKEIHLAALEARGQQYVGQMAAARALMLPSGDSVSRVVVPLFSNTGFLPYLRNLICSMTRVNVHNWCATLLD